MQRSEIVLERRIAKPELDRAKAAGEELFRLVGQPLAATIRPRPQEL